MKEIVVISGKGGTGKTSLLASFAVLAQDAVIADCDVDAANLHLVLSPDVQQRHEFWSGHEARINAAECLGCGLCQEYCRFDAIFTYRFDVGGRVCQVDPAACEGCGVCTLVCTRGAVEFADRLCGEWMMSDTRVGPMVHARLGIAAENSGKLVSTVRQQARKLAEQPHKDLVLVDGPPGIGCPVIAAIGGVSHILVVTEPSVSGLHDLKRVLELARHFDVPCHVCVNKWDLNPDQTDRIEQMARNEGAVIAGRIRYDRSATKAQMDARAIVETNAPSATDIRGVWAALISDQTGEIT